jgi:hypothetical protein
MAIAGDNINAGEFKNPNIDVILKNKLAIYERRPF